MRLFFLLDSAGPDACSRHGEQTVYEHAFDPEDPCTPASGLADLTFPPSWPPRGLRRQRVRHGLPPVIAPDPEDALDPDDLDYLGELFDASPFEH